VSNPRVAAFALTLALLLGSCDWSPTAPAKSHGLELSVHVGLPNIGVFPSDPVFTAELINTSAEVIRLVFPSTCVVLPYIDDLRGANVYPGGRAWLCGGAITPVTLAPGQVVSRSVVLRTGTTPALTSGTLTLPPGRYVAYAEMDGSIGDLGGQRVQLRAPGAPFRLP
jgi:hypothetical protein